MNIKHLVGGLALAGLLLAGGPAPASKAPVKINDAIIDALISQGARQLDAKDDAGAIETYSAAIANPVFASTSREKQLSVYYGLGLAESDNGDDDAAFAAMDKGRALAGDGDDAFWYSYAIIAHIDHHYDAAADGLANYARLSPDHLNDMDDDEVSLIVRDSGKAGGNAKQNLLEALWGAKYHPSNPFWTGEWLWSELFEIYAVQGNDDKAREILPALVSPDSVLDIRIDNRFARFVAADPGRFDYGKAQDAEIASDRQLADAHPDLLAGVHNLAEDLGHAGQLDAALQVTGDAIAKAEADHQAYSDSGDYLRWVHDGRAGALARLGRWDEAAAEMVLARQLSGSDDKVSQTINLADIYYEMGKPQDALDTVKDMDAGTASPYGVMSADEARACAYAELGDGEKLAETLHYVTAHIDDGWEPARSALLCAGDVDRLAMHVIARLDDPDTRVETLVSAQDYMPLPHPSAMQTKMAGTWAKVMGRDDVTAAIAKYGVIISVPTYPPTY